MTIRKLFGLAAIGGLIYAHRKRGGQMTLDSFKQSARDLLDGAKTRAQSVKSQAEGKLHEAAEKVADKTDQKMGQRSGMADDVTGYGSSGFGNGTGSSTRKY